MSDVVLESIGLSRNFGGVRAVIDVDLQLHDQEVLGLIGPNGAGKSTYFNVVSGVYKPTAGKVLLYGAEIQAKSPSRICRLGLVRTFQHQSVFPEMTVRQNLTIAAMGPLNDRPVEDVVLESAEFVGLTEQLEYVANEIPHGHERLLSVGMAHASSARVLCFDEPLAGLNQVEAEEVLSKVRSLRDDRNCSVLFVDHNIRAVMSLCDRIAVMDGGKKIADASPMEVQNDERVIAAYIGE